VSFSAQDDEGGSGAKEILYSATGAQSMATTIYNAINSPIINTEGTTTVGYFANDDAGNQESPAKTLVVKIDRTPPTVSSTSPSNNATGVAATAKISATFSENGSGIYPDSVNVSVVQVKRTGNVPVSGALSYDESSKKVTFTPSRNLAKGAYRASVSVWDKVGNAPTDDYTWQFATAGPSKK
jgi:methionine-rich copper-binding protein CopC